MLARISLIGLSLAAVAGFTATARADDPKSDRDTVVPAGKELQLTAVEIVVNEKASEDGRFGVTLKPAKAATAVKMPETAYLLGFKPAASKKDGVEVGELSEVSALQGMRTEAKSDDGNWTGEAGDVITHVNGYAVNSIEEVVCATSLAKDKKDVQIVVKDANDGKQYVFYVTANKK